MIALTLDPGVTTGYVNAEIGNEHVVLEPGQERWDHQEFFNVLKTIKPDIIIYETFMYRRNLGNAELFPRELIGIINLYTASPDSDLVHTFDQMPAQKEGHFKDKDRIKELNLWVPGKPHAMDAMRHFLMWWTFGPGYQFNKGQTLALV